MPESHQRDLAQIERPTDVELSCRELVGSGLSLSSHRISFCEGTDNFLPAGSAPAPYPRERATAPVAPKMAPGSGGIVDNIGISGLAVVVMSVGFARSKAAGHVYHESAVPPSPVALVLGAQVEA